MKESDPSSNQNSVPNSEALQQWASFYENMGDNESANDFTNLSQTEQTPEKKKEALPGQDLQEQLEAFYENMGDSESAAQLRESSEEPKSEPAETNEKLDYDKLFLREKLDGTLPEGVTDAYELRYYMEEQAARAAEAEKNGQKVENSGEKTDVPTTDETNNSETTSSDVHQDTPPEITESDNKPVSDTIEPENSPAPEDTESEDNSVPETIEPENNPTPEAIDSENNPAPEETEPQIDVEKDLQDYRRSLGILREIQPKLIKQEDAPAETANSEETAEKAPTQQRGQKVLSALTRRRVELAKRMADHARVETFDSSYQSAESQPTHIAVEAPVETAADSAPQAATSNSSVPESTPVEELDNKESAPAEEPDQAKETEEQVESAEQKLERVRRNTEILKEITNHSVNSGEKKDSDFKEDDASEKTDQYEDITNNAILKTELDKESTEQLRTEQEEYLEKKRILEIFEKIRREGDSSINDSDYQMLTKSNDYASNLYRKSDAELEQEKSENERNIHLRRIILTGRDRASESQESVA